MRSLGVLAVLVLCSRAVRADEPAPAPTPYYLGLERTLSDEITTTEGRSLAGYLSAALNHPVKGRIYATYDELATALAQGKVDLAWINPYAFVKASQASHVFPVAKALRRGDSYRAVYFVRSDSKAKKLADLKGLKVAWVDHLSTAGYLFPQAMLVKEHLPLAGFFASETFAGTHKAVCEAVLSGAADVGATFHTGDASGDMRPDGCVETLGADAASKVVGIAASDAIPSEVIAARAGFDEAVAAKLTGILAGMSETATGRDMLRTIFRADGFGITLDTDFDGVRAAVDSVAAARNPPPPPPPAKTKKKGKKKSGGK